MNPTYIKIVLGLVGGEPVLLRGPSRRVDERIKRSFQLKIGDEKLEPILFVERDCCGSYGTEDSLWLNLLEAVEKQSRQHTGFVDHEYRKWLTASEHRCHENTASVLVIFAEEFDVPAFEHPQQTEAEDEDQSKAGIM